MCLQIKLKKGFIGLMYLTCVFTILSCEKSESDNIQEGPANVTVELAGVESDDDAGPAAAEHSAADSSRINAIQTSVIPFTRDISILATLTPEPVRSRSLSSKSNQVMSKSADHTAKSAGGIAAIVRQPLAANVRYRVLVYDSAGTYVTDKIYTYGSEAAAGGFALDAGSSYTFVSYSVNSLTAVPSVTNQNALATARVAVTSGSLMYFTQTLRLLPGQNRLSIILKHRFTEITTKIELDPTTAGNITAISGVTLQTTRASGTISLLDGSIAYGAAAPAGAPVVFPALGAGLRTITSSPTSLISPNNPNGIFNIGSITVNNVTRGDIALNAVNIFPGRRYNLNLLFKSPCTISTTTDNTFNFNLPTAPAGTVPPTKTVTAPGADYGFVLDITRLDNSFSMTVNGVSLIKNAVGSVTNREVQFETGVAASPRNIIFSDNSIWTVGGTPAAIYQLTGTATNPIIRVVISPSGDVSMFGSKTSGGPLFSLKLTNDYLFNKVPWNTSGDNTVTISQGLNGATNLTGTGSGRKITPCP